MRKTASIKCNKNSKNMKATESYWKDTAAVCWGDTMSRFIRISNFLAFLRVFMIFLFDQTKEREKCFGFIT